MPKHAASHPGEWLCSDQVPPAAGQLEHDAAAGSFVAPLNAVAGELFDVLGPMFWAALIVLSLVAQIGGG